MLLSDVFTKQSINIHLESETKDDAFRELIETIVEIHDEFDRDTMLAVVQDRETKMNTYIAPGIAIPHGYYPGTGSIFGALGVSKSGIDYDAPDQKPVHCIFLIIMGEAPREKNLQVLTRVMSLVDSGGLSLLRKAQSPEEIHAILSRIQ
ncbi:MAG: PTS sugar transporter subunit IIA [Treponema sp.]|nr:PTS sugar transporter subunit IIA [Treponema sp.]